MHSIDIDFDVYRLIALERRSFDETENATLRRLLKLGPASTDAGPAEKHQPWVKGGLSLPHGTQVRMEYNGTLHLGRIVDGAWEVEGHREKSPSGAACAVARSKDGTRVNINGKNYWQVRRPGDTDWLPFAGLKRRK